LTDAGEIVGEQSVFFEMVDQTLQIRFQLKIRFQFRILTCDPNWTNFSGRKKKRSILRF
jgi:hypothetical protein